MAQGILVIADHLDGRVSDATNEAIGAAVSLGPKGLGPVSVVVISREPDRLGADLALAGVETAYMAAVETDHFDPRVYERVVTSIARKVRPGLILAGHSINSMTYAPALAAKVGCGLATDVSRMDMRGGGLSVVRSTHQAKVESEFVFPEKSVSFVTLRGGSFSANAAGTAGRVETVEVPDEWKTPAVTHLGYEQPAKSDVDISKADLILSIGRGVQDEANIERFRQLASRLGMTFGCSRPLVDAGWLPKPHQVGQSGTMATSCRLYVALGISGAVQHLHGMKHVPTIVAINKDPDAPIFNVARYGAALDMFEFADALEREFAAG